jgi:hypothetical protein
MSLRSRLSSALGALLGEPSDLAKALDEQRALTEYERMTRRRYSLHLDDIRCDLADAGIPIPEDDDPEMTPRRMVRALIASPNSLRRLPESAWPISYDGVLDESIEACDILGIDRDGDYDYLATLRALKERADGKAAKPAPAVPEARRMAILREVAYWIEFDQEFGPELPSATDIAGNACGDDAFAGVALSSVARLVSSLAREGWLVADGKRPLRYTLTEKGRAALADSARVAS